jgi:hypothetical protein
MTVYSKFLDVLLTLMARANVPLNIRYKVFTKAFKTATLLDGLTVIKIGNKEATRYEHC